MSSSGDGDMSQPQAQEGPRPTDGALGATSRKDAKSKAEARAMRKAKRERDSRLSKSVQAPRFVGYEDESARLFSADDIGSFDDDNSSDPGGQSKNAETTGEQPQDNSSDIKDAKAAARELRKAKRELDTRMGKMVEAPRMLDYEDESSRFFGVGGDPSSRNINVSLDEDNAHVEEKASFESKGVDDTSATAHVKVEGENAGGDIKHEKWGDSFQDDNKGEDIAEEGQEMQNTNEEEHNKVVSIKDAKAHARAMRKSRRDDRLSKSTEAPRMRFGYEFESSKSVNCDEDSNAGESNESPSLNAMEVDDESKHGTVGEGRESPQSISSSQSEGEAMSIEENLYLNVDELQNPTTIHSKSNSSRTNPAESFGSKDSTHDASETSLGLDDLRRSADRSYGRQASVNSIVSELSLGMDDIEEESPIKEPFSSSTPTFVVDNYRRNRRSSVDSPFGANRPVNKGTLHASLMPRRRSRDQEDPLRRSRSGAALENTRSIRLEALNLESKKKKPAAQRAVARSKDGKLDSSMNASLASSMLMKPSALASLTDSLKIPLTALKPSSSLTEPSKRQDSRESGEDGDVSKSWHSPSKRRSLNVSWPESRRSSEPVPLRRNSGAVTRKNRKPKGSRGSNTFRRSSRGGLHENELDNIADSGHASVGSITHSALGPTAEGEEEECSNKSDTMSDVKVSGMENDEEECNNNSRPLKRINFFGWTPFRRYHRRSAQQIKMMENQFFIPPPEEGTTFFESLFYTLHEKGNDFVVWIYQASFFTVLAMFFFAYYALVFSFAGILVAMESRTGGRCGLVVFETYRSSLSLFELAFELSWTTFTTVGYGLVSPSGDDSHCYPIRFMCSMFAFMGLLFNSLSAAIFFSKLERVLTRASVTFSSSVCLQFGQAATFTRGSSGVYGQFWMKNHSMRSLASIITDASRSNRSMNTTASAGSNASDSPFPFLEFRIVNDHANHKNRAVRNAHVTAMVQLSARDADNAQNGMSLGKRSSSKGTFREYVSVASKDQSSTKEDDEPPLPVDDHNESFDSSGRSDKMRFARANRRGGLTPDIIATALIVQESDNNDKGSGLEGRVYYPMKLDPHDHPYFRRVFYLRHTLDAKSPLLKPNVREKIKKDGCWDPERNRHQDILASLVDFHRIRLTFKGTSAVSNALVFAQKVFTIEDVYVGWQFGDIFYRRERSWFRRLLGTSKQNKEEDEDKADDENLLLDKRLIHDILPQPGGGHEPIEG